MNNYVCNCNAGFTGRYCDVPIMQCDIDSCYPGVPCTENSNSAVTCGSCPSGLTGDGKHCKGKSRYLITTLSNNVLSFFSMCKTVLKGPLVTGQVIFDLFLTFFPSTIPLTFPPVRILFILFFHNSNSILQTRKHPECIFHHFIS